MDGLPAKGMAKVLGTSPRTVEMYRVKLMRKYDASISADLVHKLMSA